MRYLTLALLIGCHQYQGSCEVPVVNYWYEEPTVIEICDDNRVDETRVIYAFQWWSAQDISYPLLGWPNVTYSACQKPPEPGVIRITQASLESLLERTGAYCTYHFDNQVIEHPVGIFNNYDYMYAATVAIRKLNSDNVLIHEVGHALGWDHVPGDGHIMSHSVGNETCGLDQWNLLLNE